MRREIRLGILPATVMVQPEWLTQVDMAVSQAAEMEALLARLAPRHMCLHPNTPRTDRVSVSRASLDPLYLVHPLMVSPFLAPATKWHMMQAKSRRHGDDPSGGTVPQLVKGGDN